MFFSPERPGPTGSGVVGGEGLGQEGVQWLRVGHAHEHDLQSGVVFFAGVARSHGEWCGCRGKCLVRAVRNG